VTAVTTRTFGIILAAAALISGCGTAVTGSGGAAPASPSPSVPVFPKTMNPDGTVPWVSTPAVNPLLTPAPAPPPAVGPTCTAGQLRGVLPAWISGEASNDGGMDPLAAASLHGWVNLTNVSGRPCTLDGVPAVTLLSRGAPVRVSYARFGTGEAVKVGLPAHGAANFRIDWGAPYCPDGPGPFPGPPDQGPFSLRAVIDGLTLDIAVHSTASPACDLTETEPDATTSSVVTSPVSPGAVAPGPGYQFARLYALNTGPRPVIPAHGAVRFAMQLAIPALACPTARLTVSWQPSFATGGPHASFPVAVRG
jgi:Protein of unknown function (DUF4232)